MTERKPKFRRRAEARPDEVLDAALALFIERGYEATRVDDIARRAGISKGSVYLYFQSKQAVLEGLVQRAVVPVADSVFGAVAQFRGDPRPFIAQMMHMMAAQLAGSNTLDIPKLVMREALVVPEIAEMYRKAVLDRAIPGVAGLISNGIEDGYLRPVEPELAVRNVVGPVLVHVLLFEIFGIAPEDGFDIDTFIDTHLDILFNGLSATPNASDGGAQ